METLAAVFALGKSCCSSKYALTERLVCGECGILYRRWTWTEKGQKRIMWRCVSRLDYGKKYCKNSPTIDEGPLQRMVLAAINIVMSDKGYLIHQITNGMKAEIVPIPGEIMTIADIEHRMEEINEKTHEIIMNTVTDEDKRGYADSLKAMLDEMTYLKEKQTCIEEQHRSNAMAIQRIEQDMVE